MKTAKTLFIIIFLFSFFNNNNCFATQTAPKDSVIFLNGHKVLLTFTNKPVVGTILLLQGWNFPPTDWCNRTTICKVALEKGYNLVMPDMGKSIYHSQVFKETRADWVKYPTRKWLVETLFIHLNKEYGLFEISARNFVIGLSTGARGAVLVAMDCPGLFKGVAALSGDYNQLALPNDNLCKGYYGAYSSNKLRWKTVDNPSVSVAKLKTPIYLSHGLTDKVVPCSQTTNFYKEIKKTSPNLNVKLHTPKANHDYQFWGSEVPAIFAFFDAL